MKNQTGKKMAIVNKIVTVSFISFLNNVNHKKPLVKIGKTENDSAILVLDCRNFWFEFKKILKVEREMKRAEPIARISAKKGIQQLCICSSRDFKF